MGVSPYAAYAHVIPNNEKQDDEKMRKYFFLIGFVIYFYQITSIYAAELENTLYVNEKLDHNKIKTIFITVEDRDSLVLKPSDPEIRILIQDWIPPKEKLLDILNFKWADSDNMNISEWENSFLKNGYNVIDRSHINKILREQEISLAGFNDKFECAKLASADAIFIINKLSISSNDTFPVGYEKWTIKLISVESSEIIMSSSFFSMFGKNSPEDEMIKHVYSFDNWKKNIIQQYKKEVMKMKSKGTNIKY